MLLLPSYKRSFGSSFGLMGAGELKAGVAPGTGTYPNAGLPTRKGIVTGKPPTPLFLACAGPSVPTYLLYACIVFVLLLRGFYPMDWQAVKFRGSALQPHYQKTTKTTRLPATK